MFRHTSYIYDHSCVFSSSHHDFVLNHKGNAQIIFVIQSLGCQPTTYPSALARLGSSTFLGLRCHDIHWYVTLIKTHGAISHIHPLNSYYAPQYHPSSLADVHQLAPATLANLPVRIALSVSRATFTSYRAYSLHCHHMHDYYCTFYSSDTETAYKRISVIDAFCSRPPSPSHLAPLQLTSRHRPPATRKISVLSQDSFVLPSAGRIHICFVFPQVPSLPVPTVPPTEQSASPENLVVGIYDAFTISHEAFSSAFMRRELQVVSFFA
jgi:hypothetical protein